MIGPVAYILASKVCAVRAYELFLRPPGVALEPCVDGGGAVALVVD